MNNKHTSKQNKIILRLFIIIVIMFLYAIYFLQDANRPIQHIRSFNDLPFPTNLESRLTTERVSGRLPMELIFVHGDFPFTESGFVNGYYLWSQKRLYFEPNESNWGVIKSEYDDLLTENHFKQIESFNENIQYEFAVWERENLFGLDGEIIALVWVEQADEIPILLMLFGFDT